MTDNTNRPVFNMNQCQTGDVLTSVHGLTIKYLRKDESPSQYPYVHKIQYFDGVYGSRTDEECPFLCSECPHTLDGEHYCKSTGHAIDDESIIDPLCPYQDKDIEPIISSMLIKEI